MTIQKTTVFLLMGTLLMGGPGLYAQEKKDDGDLRRRVLESLRNRQKAQEEKPAPPSPPPAPAPQEPDPVRPTPAPRPAAEEPAKPAPVSPPVLPAPAPKPVTPPTKPLEQPKPTTAQPPATPTPAAPFPRTYTVRGGDTFSGIAQQFYGDEKHWIAIAKANPLVDPTKLSVDQVLRLPDLNESAAAREKELQEVRKEVTSGGGEKTVLVEPGDNLGKIAQRVYGRANRWRILFDANRDQLDSPDTLQVGMKLKVPALPAEAER